MLHIFLCARASCWLTTWRTQTSGHDSLSGRRRSLQVEETLNKKETKHMKNMADTTS